MRGQAIRNPPPLPHHPTTSPSHRLTTAPLGETLSDAAALQTLAPGMMAGMGVPAFPPAAAAPGPVGAAAAEPGADAGDGKVEVAFRMIAPNARTGECMSG